LEEAVVGEVVEVVEEEVAALVFSYNVSHL
jgi:hypothetical protein